MGELTLRQIHGLMQIRSVQIYNDFVTQAKLHGRGDKLKMKSIERKKEELSEKQKEQMGKWIKEAAQRKVLEMQSRKR